MPIPLQYLLAEDNATDAELLVFALRRGGFAPVGRRVDTEADFAAALHDGLDLVLSDYEMPQFSGLRALRLARERYPEIPFIIVSGTIGEETAVEAMRQGATDYMLKDRLARLGPAIERAIAESRLRRERRQTEAALRASEERFRQLAENIREVFWLTDPAKSAILYISPAYEVIWGRPADSLYADPRGWLEAIHPEDRERILLAATTRQAAGTYDEEYRIVRSDGAVRWIRDRAYPVRDETGRVIRIAGVAEDVTDRKQLEAQLAQSQKMEAIGQLSGGVAHDFNNLLTVIKGHLGLLQLDGLVIPSIAGSIKQIDEAADRAANLTRQLLAFSRRQVLQPGRHNLNQLVANMVKMLRRLLREDIELEVAGAAESLPIQADLGMVEQVLLNLVVNARDAMPQGGRLRLLTLAVELPEAGAAGPGQPRAGRFACLEVADTGTGIPPAILPRIFEPFFTTKEVGKGTGLGLATVYGVMQQHGGWVSVESRVGEGATFRVYFPLVEGTTDAVPAPAEQPLRGGRETILLVEDEEAVRIVAESALRDLGYKVLCAENGAAAAALWRTRGGEIGLVLTDLVMPGGVNGRELGRLLAGAQPPVPVIYMSGYSHEVAGSGFELVEGQNYLAKPFDVVQLARILRVNLDRPRPAPG